MMRSGGRMDDVAVVEIKEHGGMNVRERASAGPLKSLISGVGEWVALVASYEPYNGLADRSRNRAIESRRFHEQARLHRPDGVPVNGIHCATDRFNRNS